MLASKLADKIGQQHIVYNSPVTTVSKIFRGNVTSSSSFYNVTISNGKTYTGKKVVVAMSPPMAVRIEYSPILPAARDQLCQHMPMGSIGKAIAVYDTPFWRSDRLSGQVLSKTGAARTTFDQSPRNGEFGALMGFLEAAEVRKLDKVDETVLKDKVSRDFVAYFGPRAANATAWVFQRWDNEEFSRGGPVAVPSPDILTQYGTALKQPVDGIHFAGTESSDYWVGYMDGALRSGERAGREVIMAMSPN